MTGQTDPIASPDPSASAAREYGRAGVFGIVTPPANPTVEPELRILLPAGTAMLVARLPDLTGDLRARLVGYGDTLGGTLAGFGGLRFDALGFACTGTSYLVDPDAERRRLGALEDELGYRIVTAAGAIGEALGALGVEAVALVSPYPDWLTEASRAHWVRCGLRVTTVLRLPSGSTGAAHGIYELTTPAVLDRCAGFEAAGADAILLTGTGMPSLRLILALGQSRGLPVLSSNLCLAWALAGLRGGGQAGPESPLYGGWGGRMALA
jgi:maleate isomerase